MRVIKLAFISIIVFSLLITVISLFFPSRIRISKAIDIQAGKDAVMVQVANAANWKNWYPGADTLALLINDGKTEGLKLPGLRGLIRITAINDSSVIAATAGPGIRESVTGWNIIGGNNPNSITVQWYMDFHLRWYPWEKFSSLLLEKRYGPMMEKGLGKLKVLLEK